MKWLVTCSLIGFLLIGCGSSEGGDGGVETATSQAKAEVNKNMSQEQQTELASKIKAWDPKKDKK